MKPIVRTLLLTLLICPALARPAIAERAPILPTAAAPATAAPATPTLDASALENFRGQYDVMMASYEFLLGAQGKSDVVERVRAGREAMKALTDQQLDHAFSRSGVPDLSSALLAYRNLVQSFGKKKTPVLPTADPIVSGCDGVDITPGTRYGLFIAKEVVNSILAAAAWACNEDILGENGSLYRRA